MRRISKADWQLASKQDRSKLLQLNERRALVETDAGTTFRMAGNLKGQIKFNSFVEQTSMLLSINIETRYPEKKRTENLGTFKLDERALQGILFQSLDRLFPEDELILLMQSRRWREEPDLMAIDKDGNLYIFELKIWESKRENLLQVLRYGQIFGASQYDDLYKLYERIPDKNQSLKNAHELQFSVEIQEQDFNRKQIFVVMTNGLDYRTREAIQYWRRSGLDIRPWVYRVYQGNDDEMLLEISAFRVEDNPYEDIAEGYYILNTNLQDGSDPTDHNDMLNNSKAAAYFRPWKYKIESLNRGDFVFLYQSRSGIVAFGKADGRLQKNPYHGNPDDGEDGTAEYCMQLRSFQKVAPPLTAAEIKTITGVNYVFMHTMFGIGDDSGQKLMKHLLENGRLRG